jgi:hypothetical protein
MCVPSSAGAAAQSSRKRSAYQDFVSKEIKSAVSTGGKRNRDGMKQLMKECAGKWKSQKSTDSSKPK